MPSLVLPPKTFSHSGDIFAHLNSPGDLGVVALPRPGNAALGYPTTSEVLYAQGERLDAGSSYEQWLDIPYEEPSRPAILATPTSRLSFDSGDLDDIGRVANLAAQELGLDERDVREALSRVQPGRTVTLTRRRPSLADL